jgi:aspartyl-tRNA(Asn)/glutamyl-tRNA(Gln) amidotransferase subunit A
VSASHDLTIRDAGRLVRSGSLSPVELTRGVLARIEATEPVVHAYVWVLADDALAAAREAERELRAGRDRGPLHGIPIAVKDLFDVAGVPTRCGSDVLANAPAATADAEAVARLRAAGAIVVGKVVTHEFAASVISHPARNPWDPSRIPGGSSGGSGAAVAAGSCLGALSSDTGGSIRVPAALNGVAGLKPTRGLVSTRGVFPLAWSVDTVGPHAKTVDDVMLMLDAMVSGGSGAERGRWTTPAGPPNDTLRGIRIGVPRPYFFDRLQPAVATAVEAAIARLGELGAEVIETPWAEAGIAAAAGAVVIRSETASIHAATLRTVPERYGPGLRARLEAFSLYPARGYLRGRQVRTMARRTMAELFATHRLDALVMPTTAATATTAGATTVAFPDGEEPIHAAFVRLTIPFNTTGQPALSIPCGFDAAGLPIGLQLAGAPWGEATLARIGRTYERTAGWSARRPIP